MALGQGQRWQGARKGFQAVPTQPPLPPDQQGEAASGGHRGTTGQERGRAGGEVRTPQPCPAVRGGGFVPWDTRGAGEAQAPVPRRSFLGRKAAL